MKCEGSVSFHFIPAFTTIALCCSSPCPTCTVNNTSKLHFYPIATGNIIATAARQSFPFTTAVSSRNENMESDFFFSLKADKQNGQTRLQPNGFGRLRADVNSSQPIRSERLKRVMRFFRRSFSSKVVSSRSRLHREYNKK